MKPKPKKEFLTRKRWKHCVQALSCLVVFCTVYMLILPIITLEAKSYCGKEEHSHSPDCFIEIDQCGLIEHEHDEFCCDDEGSLICPLDEHVHDDSCSDRILECGKTEHKHELICFSNPEADLDKPENWEKKIDEIKTDNPDFTKRQLITAIAKSQEGQKESLDNYKVQDETVKKGISRYGIWDDDPYEDWSGAFARFVLSYSGFEDELTTYPKDTDEWLEQLNKEEKLLPVLDGKQGDVLFAYTEQDELKAGIITDNNDDRITAIMGDWQDKVSRQTFQIDDSNLHSIFKITPDDPDKDQKDNEDENSSDDQFDKTDQASDPDQNKDQSSSSEDSNDNPAGPADFTESNGKFNSSFNDTSDEDTSKGDDNKTSQSNENSNNPDGKESDEKDVTDSLKDKPENSSDSSSEDESNKPGKSDSKDDCSSSEKDSSENSSENSESESDSKDSSDKKPTDDSQESGEEESEQDEKGKDSEEDGSENSEGPEKESKSLTLTAKAEDGSEIQVAWTEGTFFCPDEEVLFQARPAVLTETENAKIRSYLNPEENYLFREYDLGFYRKNEDTAELEKIEPAKPVEVKIHFARENSEDDTSSKAQYLFHIKDNGSIEYISDKNSGTKDSSDSEKPKESDPASEAEESDSKTSQNSKTPVKAARRTAVKADTKAALSQTAGLELIDVNDKTVTFRTGSFSKYITVHLTSGNNEITNSNRNIKWGEKNVLKEDIDGWTCKDFNSSSNYSVTEIDLAGHTLKGDGPLFRISNGHKLIITNSKAPNVYENNGNSANVDGGTTHKLSYTNRLSSYNDDGNLTTRSTQVSNIGMLIGNKNNVIEVTNGGILQVENIGICSWNGTGIKTDHSKVDLENTYVVQGNRGLEILNNSEVRISDGAIADHNSGTNQGAGIYCKDSTLLLEDGVEVSGNRAWNDAKNECSAGGIAAAPGSNLTMEECYVSANYTTNNDNNGSFATGAGIKAWDGAVVKMNHPRSTVSNNWARGSGGGISIQGDNTKLFMYDGQITGNICRYNEGGGLALQAQRGNSQAYLVGGTISENRSLTTAHWGGGGVFCGEDAKLILPLGAYVTNNQAEVYGGGIAGCSTGKIVVDDSVIVAGNKLGNVSIDTRFTSGAKPHDREYANKIGLTKEDAHDYFTCFYASVNGQFEGAGASWYGKVDTAENNVSDINSGWITSQTCLGLTSHYTGGGQGKKLVIKDNFSNMHGGGILINGYLIGGDVEYIYNSDVISLKGKKTVVDPEGNVNGNPEGYQFELWNADETNLISSGKSDSLGNFSIPSAALDANATGTLRYILKEGSATQAGVVNDTRKYKIEISVTTTVEPEWTYEVEVPILDENNNYIRNEDGTIQTQKKQVTVREYDTNVNNDGIQVFKLPENTPRTVHVTHLNQSEGNHTLKTQWTVNLSPDSNAAFENKRINSFTLEVLKTWDDGNENHKDHTVKVQLYRSLNADRSNPEPYLDAAVLNYPDWKYQYEGLPSTDQNNNPYIYWIEEAGVFDQNGNSLSGYLTKINEITEITNPGPSEDPKYIEQTAWIQTDSLIAGNTYILVDKSNNKALGEANTGNVSSSNLVPLTRLSGTQNDVIAYSQDNDAQIMIATEEWVENQKRAGLVMRSESNKNYGLAGDYDNNVLHWYDGNLGQSNDLNGFEISNGNIRLYRWKVGTTDFDHVVCKDGSFALVDSRKTSYPNAAFFKLGTVMVKENQNLNGNKKYQVTIENKKIVNSVTLIKTDEYNSKNLAGAKFGIYSDNQATMLIKDGTTDENGKLTFGNLVEGTYWIKEIEAPEGYELSNEIFEVNFANTQNQDSVITVEKTVTNKAIHYELPETGSSGTQWLTYGGLMLMAGSGLYLSRQARRRKAGG